MTKLKMILGICHCIFVVTMVFIVVILTDNKLLREVLAQVEGPNDQVILNTADSGTFVGVKKSVEVEPNEVQRHYFAFKGIAYAEKPIGELRWKPPVPIDTKTPTKNATQYKPACSQWSVAERKVVGSEDCLYLNIFTPYIPTSLIRRPLVGNLTSWTVYNPNLLPVLLFVHGGELLVDSSTSYGPGQFMKENVVLVTFNFRLGLPGFLSTGDENLAGNYGLLDQIEVLKWTQSNIHRFGGNPSRVTVFGAVDYLLASPKTEGLFQAAIIVPMSTSVWSPFSGSVQNHPTELFDYVAQENQCSRDTLVETVSCMRELAIDSLIETQRKMLRFSSFPKRIAPVIDLGFSDEPVLLDTPTALFDKGDFTKVPIMLGVSAYEGFIHFAEFYFKMKPGRYQQVANVRNQLYDTLKIILNAEDSQYDRMFESIWRYYFGGIKNFEDEADRTTSQLFRLFGDLTVYSGHRKLLRSLSLSTKVPVFNYVFNHSIQYFPEYLDMKLKGWKQNHDGGNESLFDWSLPPWKELYYLFENSEIYNKTSRTRKDIEDDDIISEFLGKMWISFAKYGSPKQAISKLQNFTKWQKIGENNINYYDLRPEPFPMNTDFRKAESQFWLNTLPQIQDLSDKINDLQEYPFWFWMFAGLFMFFLLLSIILAVFIMCYKAIQEGKYREDNVVNLHYNPM